jgi:hypothetical protein
MLASNNLVQIAHVLFIGGFQRGTLRERGECSYHTSVRALFSTMKSPFCLENRRSVLPDRDEFYIFYNISEVYDFCA